MAAPPRTYSAPGTAPASTPAAPLPSDSVRDRVPVKLGGLVPEIHAPERRDRMHHGERAIHDDEADATTHARGSRISAGLEWQMPSVECQSRASTIVGS